MKYAIIESGGKQYKAVEGATIEVDRLPVQAGENVKLEQVLLLTDGENITVGTPTVKGLAVWAKALEHFKGRKVIIFKYRPKKRIRVKTGHRQAYTRLLIEQIGGSTLAPQRPPAKKVEPAVEKKEAKALPAKPVQKGKKPAKASLAKKQKKETKLAPSKPAPKKMTKTTPKKTTKVTPKVTTKKAPKKTTKTAAKKAAQ